MHRNGIFYALICINDHVITSISFILSLTPVRRYWLTSYKDGKG